MSLIYTSPSSRHNLYLGGKVDAKSRSTLQQRNVRRILNVTPAKEAGITAGVPNYFENSRGSKIKYKRISVYDASTSDLLSRADEMVEFISNGLHHGGVLVHCQRGASRSATAVVMFLMRKANMTMKQSLALCRKRRPVVDPIPAFVEQLMSYERECRTGGHLTAVDGKYDGAATKKNSEKDGSGKDSAGEKRKVKDISPGEGKKRRTVGPSIGPVGPPRSIGPVGPPRGPVSSNVDDKTKNVPVGPAIGPAGPPRGPENSDTGDEKKAAIGPAMGPSSIGPVGPPRGPVSSNVSDKTKKVPAGPAIGPAGPPRGPANSDTGDEKKAAIGPAMGPTS